MNLSYRKDRFYGLKTMDIMSVFDPENLDAFRKRVEEIDLYIASEIRKHEVVIKEYVNLEEFLKNNG